jgi:hypothetical protein
MELTRRGPLDGWKSPIKMALISSSCLVLLKKENVPGLEDDEAVRVALK